MPVGLVARVFLGNNFFHLNLFHSQTAAKACLSHCEHGKNLSWLEITLGSNSATYYCVTWGLVCL